MTFDEFMKTDLGGGIVSLDWMIRNSLTGVAAQRKCREALQELFDRARDDAIENAPAQC